MAVHDPPPPVRCRHACRLCGEVSLAAGGGELGLPVVPEVALRRAQNEMRDLAAGIQEELDRPRCRIEPGLSLRNKRKVLHVQLPMAHADDLCGTEERVGSMWTFSKLVVAGVPHEH